VDSCVVSCCVVTLPSLPFRKVSLPVAGGQVRGRQDAWGRHKHWTSMLQRIARCHSDFFRSPNSGPGVRSPKSSLPDQYYSNHLRQIAEIPQAVSFRWYSLCSKLCALSRSSTGENRLFARVNTAGRHCDGTMFPRLVSESKHRNPTPRVLLGTCDASLKARKDASG
jgi:hypothetical protein